GAGGGPPPAPPLPAAQ
nr:Chain V, Vasodilator-stimulated phosphoprotein [synthetic construct]3CHW_V Chain V, Vasodilator-stimulated phosphoprotein 16-residue peptide [synthetic construct]